MGGGAIRWQSIKQSCIADSTMEAEYVAACEAAKEAVWLKKFLSDLGVLRMEQVPITKALPQRTFESHLEQMGFRLVHNSL